MYSIPKIVVDDHDDPEDLSVDVEDEEEEEDGTSLSSPKRGQSSPMSSGAREEEMEEDDDEIAEDDDDDDDEVKRARPKLVMPTPLNPLSLPNAGQPGGHPPHFLANLAAAMAAAAAANGGVPPAGLFPPPGLPPVSAAAGLIPPPPPGLSSLGPVTGFTNSLHHQLFRSGGEVALRESSASANVPFVFVHNATRLTISLHFCRKTFCLN